MTRKQRGPLWRNGGFLLRLLLSYLLIPLIPPALMLTSSLLLLWTHGAGHMAFGDWIGIVLLYDIFGLAAMVVLGTPLLWFYLRFGWTGFLPFVTGGGICAGITSYAVLHGGRGLGEVELFIVTGIISGLFFRMILFGVRGGPIYGST